MIGHMQRKDSGYKSVLSLELPHKKQRIPQRRFMDVVKEDKQRVGVSEEDAGKV